MGEEVILTGGFVSLLTAGKLFGNIKLLTSLQEKSLVQWSGGKPPMVRKHHLSLHCGKDFFITYDSFTNRFYKNKSKDKR